MPEATKFAIPVPAQDPKKKEKKPDEPDAKNKPNGEADSGEDLVSMPTLE